MTDARGTRAKSTQHDQEPGPDTFLNLRHDTLGPHKGDVAKRKAYEEVNEDNAFLHERTAILEERLQAERRYATLMCQRNARLEARLACMSGS